MKNTIKGGKADKMTAKDIADKFDVSVNKIKTQIKKGVKVEKEHTDDNEKAKEIQEEEGKLKLIVVDCVYFNKKKVRYMSLFDRKKIVQT